MSFNGNSLEESSAVVAESDDAFRLMDDWLRLENEHVDPGFVLPGRGAIVAWCESHSGAILVLANTVLWTPIVWAICRG